MFEKISKNIQKMQLCFFLSIRCQLHLHRLRWRDCHRLIFSPLFISVCASVCVLVCSISPPLFLLTPTIPFPNYNNDYKIYLYLCVSFSCFLPIFLMIICFSVVVFSVRMFLTYLISAAISRPHQNEIYSGKKTPSTTLTTHTKFRPSKPTAKALTQKMRTNPKATTRTQLKMKTKNDSKNIWWREKLGQQNKTPRRTPDWRLCRSHVLSRLFKIPNTPHIAPRTIKVERALILRIWLETVMSI